MKIIYMGTPAFAVPSLEALVKCHQVLAVCTQPDRPAGRGHKLAQSPVKVKALEYGLPVLQPETLRIDQSKEIRAALKAYNADIFVVAAYGLLLPKGVLNMPPLGCINVHASLLPKYRGASPIHAALLNGDKKSGITIMHMDAGIDTGDMIVKKELDILPDEKFPSLHDRMAVLGAKALLEALALLENGTAPRIVQDNALSTYAPMLQKSDALINWEWETDKIINMTRALDPWPGPYTMYEGKPLKIWTLERVGLAELKSNDKAYVSNYKQLGRLPFLKKEHKPGEIIAVDPKKGVLVKTGDSAVWVTELQGDGSKRMAAADYLRGREIKIGATLG
ncbi:MAG: methionyl-tRNA formyltransferase [Firmicutes bacterium]|nr:methionyl-tRNA formyltransferase [Bacillota bacterium]